jgi:uncharacterized protein (TIGR03435 family)
MTKGLVCAAALAIWAHTVCGETADKRSEFELAATKPSDPAARGMSINRSPAGGFNTTNVTLRDLITLAYDIRNFQLTGSPGWVGAERYDIVTKTEEPDPSIEKMREMVQKRLADRFQRILHKETKEAPVYALMVAERGSKLHESELNGPGSEDKKG